MYHQQWLKDKWRSHPYGSFSYRLSGRRNPGYGHHLLPPGSSQGGGLWSTPCPMSTQITRAKCGCSEMAHQLTLSPSRVLWFSIPRCENSLWGHFICTVPTGQAMPIQATPLLQHQGGPATGGGKGRVKSVSLLSGDLVDKLWGRALPISFKTTISFLITPSPSRRGLPDQEKIWLSPISKAVARHLSGQSPAWMGVSPWSRGVD